MSVYMNNNRVCNKFPLRNPVRLAQLACCQILKKNKDKSEQLLFLLTYINVAKFMTKICVAKIYVHDHIPVHGLQPAAQSQAYIRRIYIWNKPQISVSNLIEKTHFPFFPSCPQSSHGFLSHTKQIFKKISLLWLRKTF